MQPSKVGNRISKSVTENGQTVTTSYEYNSRNQLTTETVNGQDTIYSYDANGNLVKKSGVAGNETYKYDVYNRLVKYSLDDGSKSESYTYDAEGVRRSKVTVGGEETKEIFFVSDTSNELSRTVAETDKEGNVVATYSWGDTLLSQTREDITSTYLYDGHGNVRGLLDEKGCLTDTYAYNAYGELTQRTGETENHYLYTGEYYDGTTNLYYLRARYMNSSTGTFISMDTYQGDMYEPVTLHKYLYANANPVKYSDPSGNSASYIQACVSLSIDAILRNSVEINFMAAMSSVGAGTIMTVAGGTNEDIQMAMAVGFAGGFIAGVAIVVCSVLIINVMALIATIGVNVGWTSIIINAVMSIYCIMNDEGQRATLHATLLVSAYIGLCDYMNINAKGKVTSKKGSCELETNNADDVETPYTFEEALDKLNQSGIRPGQDEIRRKRVMEIIRDYDPLKAQSSIYQDEKGRFLVEGHHTTVANTMLGRGNDLNMGVPSDGGPSTQDYYWTKRWYEFYKQTIKVID